MGGGEDGGGVTEKCGGVRQIGWGKTDGAGC